ncbi:putative DNA repair protein YkoV [Phycisphaerae bacterium RAS1]|nr:putative DNA repair protein YkoV [Phycisphaerae bacterium RAS1]
MAAPRATWKGQIKLSLVAFPVKLYTAVSSASRISFNQLHKGCHRRLKQQMVCPEHGAVERGDIAKGYEYEEGKYVVIDEADFEKVKLETNHTIQLSQFVDANSLNPLYFESSYYVAPDGPLAEEAFRVIREALRAAGKIGIGRVVLSGREQIVALRTEDRGFLLTTLRCAEEVRGPTAYFEDIRNGDVQPDQLKLARQLIESMEAEFDPSQFKDRYQDSMLEIIKAKIAGSEPVIVQEQEADKIINLMDALRQSVSAAPPLRKKPPAKSVAAAAPARRKAKGA